MEIISRKHPKQQDCHLVKFLFEEGDLNSKTMLKVIKYLSENPTSTVQRPIPRCILGANHKVLCQKYKIPVDCMECSELFTIQEGAIVSCRPLDKKGPEFKYMPDRKQIWEYFQALRKIEGPIGKCKSCIYYKRNLCDALCHINKRVTEK